jgi:hypothetical protein
MGKQLLRFLEVDQQLQQVTVALVERFQSEQPLSRDELYREHNRIHRLTRELTKPMGQLVSAAEHYIYGE